MADLLDKLFEKISKGATLLTKEELQRFSIRVCQDQTQGLLTEALETFDNRSDEDVELEAFTTRAFRNEILVDLKKSRLGSATPIVKNYFGDNAESFSKAIYNQLCRAALRGLADFYSNAELIVKGELEHPDLILEELFTEELERTKPSNSEFQFQGVADKYLAQQQGIWSTKQHSSVLAMFTFFVEFIEVTEGISVTDLSLEGISTKTARAFKELLQRSPSNARKIYPALNPVEIVEAAERDGARLLGITTQNNYLQSLSSLFNFAIQELDYVGSNPFKGKGSTKKTKLNKRSQRLPFSQEQLTTLFSSPLFKGCQTLASCHKAGRMIPLQSHKYWVPLIGLYSGMREQEILQLYVEDVRQYENLWVFDLNLNHPDKRLKTVQSKRLVPLHEDLISLGFLSFLERRTKQDAKGRLFSDAPMAADGTYSSTFSKWFSRYLKNIAIKTDKTSFHSLRHNIKDGFRNSGCSDELAENFVGRSTGTTGEAYGQGFSVARLHEALHRIEFNCVQTPTSELHYLSAIFLMLFMHRKPNAFRCLYS
ncbi:site-specific integrase [Luminiphilus sp.]|nr:site-specific integrase [Luminiphilus sp.]